MNIFEFTDNGVVYVVKGPVGSTQAQAQVVFNAQKNTGSIAGLEKGTVLNSIRQASQGLTSAAAQINQAVIEKAVASTTIQTNLSRVPINNGINVGNFIKQGATTADIGGLATSTVQGLLSQTAKDVGQKVNEISNNLGVGKFGLNAQQLEQQGLIKPGMAKLIADNGGNLVGNLSSPAAWTGKSGINNLTNLLENGRMQDTIQQGLMTDGVRALTSIGAIQNLASNKEVAAVINTAAKFGTEAATRLVNGTLGDAASGIVNFAKSSEFGASFGAIAGKLNDPQAVISGLTGNLSGSLSGLTSKLTEGLPTGLNDLVGGLGKNLSGLTSGLTGQLSGLTSGLTGQLSGLTSGLTGQLSGALGGLTGQLSGQLSGALGGLTGGLGSALGGLGGISALGGLGGLGGGNPLQTGIKKAKAVFNTVNRKTVDASFQNIVGDNKVAVPDYGD